ncbi:MAG: hypothetical protein U0U66_11695 [Cytophagaceae bacterium]
MNLFKQPILFLALSLLTNSCQDQIDKVETINDTLTTFSLSQIDSIDSDSVAIIEDIDLSDTLFIEVDEFNNLKNSIKKHKSFQFQTSEQYYISDGCFFSNPTNNHYLYVATYTDGYLPTQLLYTKEIISDSIWKYIEMFYNPSPNNSFDLLTYDQKLKAKSNLVSDKFLKIENDSNFTSKYGIFLGMPIEEALDLYPIIDDKKSDKLFDYYYWHFPVDLLMIEGYLDDSYFSPDRLPMAKNSFGSKVIMISHNNKLCAYIILNEIP